MEIAREADYFDDPDIIGWTSQGDFHGHKTGLAVILTNARSGRKQMTIGAKYAGRTFVDLLGHQESPIILDDKGRAHFPVAAGSISVWVEQIVAEKL